MSVFGLTPTSSGLGDMLMSQVHDESEEQRRRRLLQQKLAGMSSGGSMSPAGAELFGRMSFGGLGR
jgi:hypothetical protein